MRQIKFTIFSLLIGVLLSGAAMADGHGRGHGKGRETGNGPGKGSEQSGDFKNHFGLSDSCWTVFTTLLSQRDTTANADTLSTSFDNNLKQIDSLRHLLDSLEHRRNTRTEIRSIIDQLKALAKTNDSLKRATGMLIAGNEKLLDSIRTICEGRTEDTTEVGDTNQVHDSLRIVSIAPNPATVGSMLNVTLTLAGNMPVTITITNLMGTTIKTYTLGVIPAGTSTQTIDLTGIPAGSYMLVVQAGSSIRTRMIMIQ